MDNLQLLKIAETTGNGAQNYNGNFICFNSIAYKVALLLGGLDDPGSSYKNLFLVLGADMTLPVLSKHNILCDNRNVLFSTLFSQGHGEIFAYSPNFVLHNEMFGCQNVFLGWWAQFPHILIIHI